MPPPKEAPYAYVNRTYGTNFKPGDRVRVTSGKEGRLPRRQSYDNYVHVQLDGMKFSQPYHPDDVTVLTAEKEA